MQLSLPQQCHEFMHRQDWLVLDTETTSLTGEVIELAIVDHSGTVVFDQLIRPAYHRIIEAAQQKHGISMLMVAGHPYFKQVWPIIATIIDGKQLIAYNDEFDRGRLQESARVNGLSFPTYKWFCMMRAYAEHVGGPGGSWIKLETACRLEQVQLTNAHRARGDALATYQLIRALAEEYNDDKGESVYA